MGSHSLFPAYSKEAPRSELQNASKEDPSKEWLQNSSFALGLVSKISLSDGEDNSVADSDIQEVEIIPAKQPVTSRKRGGKKRKHKISKKKTVPHEKSVSPIVEENKSIQSHLKKLVFIEDTGLSFERAYRVDVDCDHDNFTFGCLDRKHIAKYCGKNQIPLGLPQHELLLWPKESKKKKIKKNPRYFSCLFDVRSEKNDRLCVTQHDPIHNLMEYIPVSLTSDRTASNDASSLNNFDGISAEWKTYNQSQSTDSKYADNSTENLPLQTPMEQEINEKVAAFNKHLKENSENEQLWLDFVSFQDEVFRTLSCYKNISTLEQSIFEKKIAILDRALEHNPNSLKLTAAKLELCKGFWETDKLFSSWEQLLFLHPNDTRVWNQYLMFVLSTFSYFTIPRIIKLYSKCIKTLKSIYEGHFQSHTAAPDILEDAVDIFSQLCYILLEGGYNERALATFQALIEFNLFTPSVDRILSCEEWITLFESFWDSGVPRFGEDNAIGWAAAISKKQVYANALINSQDLNALEDDIMNQKWPQWKTWLEFENMRRSHYWLPWRPNPTLDQTMEDCEDEDRAVPFEDFAGILFMLPSEDMKFALLCRFLIFLGVELHTVDCSFFSERGKNSQLSFGSFDELSELLRTVIPGSGTSSPLTLPVSGKCKDLSTFISNVFLQAKTGFSRKYFNLLSVVQLRHMVKITLADPNESTRKQGLKYLKKFAKSSLKETESRNCLSLWTEYIFIEWTSGNKTVSEDTFENLLVASSSSGTDDGDDQYRSVVHFVTSCIKLFTGMKMYSFSRNVVSGCDKNAKFAWILAHTGSKERYVKWQSGENIRPTLVLKAAGALKAAIDGELSLLSECNMVKCRCLSPHSFAIVDFVECLMYLHYFNQGAASAAHVFREVLGDLPAKLKSVPCGMIRQQIEEQLHISYGLLLNFHTWSTTNPLTPLRSFLFEAVEKFPNNACLLHLLISLKSASSVIGQIRRFFYKLVNNSSGLSAVTWVFAIASELTICYSIQEPMLQYEVRNATSNSGISSPTFVCGLTWKVRSLFEKALQSRNSQHCVALWRAYCGFEMALGESGRAKKVFHRSLQNCAWSKALYMDAIQYFPDDFLNILNVMSEKQLRIHTPLEEISLLMDHFANSAQ